MFEEDFRIGFANPSAARAPMLSSKNWETLSSRFSLGAKLATAAGAYAGLQIFRNPAAAPVLAQVVAAAAATTAAAELAAYVCEQQALEAKLLEQQQEQQVKHELEKYKREAAARQQDEAVFKRELERSGREYRESLRNGEFLNKYRDFPSPGTPSPGGGGSGGSCPVRASCRLV